MLVIWKLWKFLELRDLVDELTFSRICTFFLANILEPRKFFFEIMRLNIEKLTIIDIS